MFQREVFASDLLATKVKRLPGKLGLGEGGFGKRAGVVWGEILAAKRSVLRSSGPTDDRRF